MTARLVADAGAARLAPAREQVPALGEWAYGWVQSYLNAWRMLLQIVRGVTEVEGEIPFSDQMALRMAEPLRAEFRRRVLAPARIAEGLDADFSGAARMLDERWAITLDEATAPLLTAAPLPAGAPLPPRLDLSGMRGSFSPALVALAPRDPLEVAVEAGAEPHALFLRSMRPIAARMAGAAVRLSEAGSFLLAGGAFGYALGGVPGVAVGSVGSIGAFWALDWAFSRVDSAMNRAGFEAQALDVLDQAQQRLTLLGVAAVEAELAARLGALHTEARGCPATP